MGPHGGHTFPMAVPDNAAPGSCPGWHSKGSTNATLPSQCFRLWKDTGTMASKHGLESKDNHKKL